MTPPRRTPLGLQALVVRMAVDPAYRARMRAQPPADVHPQDAAWLAAVDERAWATEPHRRAHLLTAVLDEYPVTGAVLGVQAADAFFSDDAFGAMLERRGRLAEAFGIWALPKVGPLAAFELAVVRARRERIALPAGASGDWVRTPRTARLVVAEGTVQAWSDRRAAMGPSPTEALAAGHRAVAFRPGKGRQERWRLVIDPQGVAGADPLTGLQAEIHALADAPRPEADLRRGAAQLGRRAAAIVDDAFTNGWWTQRP